MKNEKNQILIIEDDISLCSLLAKILESTYDVMAMNSPIDAWDWLSEGNYPDLIVTDFKMPLIDGLELVENIKTSGLFRDIPIIILSGNSDPRLQEKCKSWGINAFLTKPFNPVFLLETAKETLNPKHHA